MRDAEARLDPFLLRPIAVPRVWGGTRLLTEVHPSLDAPTDADGAPLPVGETWEVSDVGDDPALHSTIASGPHLGRTLREVLREDPYRVLGRAAVRDGEPAELPLLLKYLDAREDLSVQVHPTDALLRELGRSGRGKSEAWVILDAAPGSRLIVGLEDGWDPERYAAAVREGGGSEGLSEFVVARGDVVEIPAGLVHAIGGGILLAEIQQSSDITYRLHDWGRVGLDGAPRTLHLEDGARVPVPDPVPPCPLPPVRSGEGWACPIDGAHFRLEVWRGAGDDVPLLRRRDRFGILALLEGEGARLLWGGAGGDLPLRGGAVVFVPAGAPPGLRIRAEGPLWAIWVEPADRPRDPAGD